MNKPKGWRNRIASSKAITICKSLLWKRIKVENTELIEPVQLKENKTIFK